MNAGTATELRFDFEHARASLPVSRLCGECDVPTNRIPRLLSAMALGQTLETSFSGTTYHLARAGMAAHKLEGCFSLCSDEARLRSVQIRGGLWKLMRVLRMETTAGFKFTSACLDEVWPRHIESLAGANVISNFQLYGREFFKRRRSLDIGAYFYIDGTLTEYFESYGQYDVANIDPSTMRHAIELEREGYQSADGIVVMSKLSAQTLREVYRVPQEKISIVVPGANIADQAIEDAQDLPISSQSGDFVLGFVGLYPLRKGLDRLARATQILRARGLPIRLRVIGTSPDELKQMDGVECLGIISKRRDPGVFVNAIRGVHLGCLLSRSELAGIAMVEFLRVGVPILGTRVGGATDILEGGGSLAVSPHIAPEELAEVIADVYRDQSRYEVLRSEAIARSGWASWRRAVDQLDRVLPC